MSPFQPPRGMDDLLPREMRIKRLVEDEVRKQFKLYGYEEVETPTVEYFELFERKSGKEIRERMYVFPDRHGRRLALRPEVTPSIARLVATRLKAAPLPMRLGYIGDCYRYDEPQWGRRRRFWQAGFEIIGSAAAESDAEVLLLSEGLFRGLGLEDQRFLIGHVGILRAVMSELGVREDEQDKVLGSMDRGDEKTAFDTLSEAGVTAEGRKTIREITGASSEDVDGIIRKGYEMLQPWSSAVDCLRNLEAILELARSGGLRSRITVKLGFARGLEYYTGVVFEQYVPKVSIALNGGGRYDNLVKLFGGKDLPAVGCAVGMTRIQQCLVERGEETSWVGWERPMAIIYREGCEGYGVRVASRLREVGIPAELEVTGKKLRQAIGQYSKKGYRFIAIVGEKEKEAKTVTIRDLRERKQVKLRLDNSEGLRKAVEEGLSAGRPVGRT